MKKPMIIGGIVVLLVVIVGFATYVFMTGGAATGSGPVAAVDAAADTTTNGSPATGNGLAGDAEAGKIAVNGQVLSGARPVSNVYAGDDGTLYAFFGDTGNTISAVDSQGNIKWEYGVPDEWRVLNPFAVMLYDPSNYETANPAGMDLSGYLNFGGTTVKPVFATDEGVLYLFIRENRTTRFNHGLNDVFPLQPEVGDWLLKERLLAISPGGKLLWDVPISDVHHVYDDASVIAKNGRIYVYEDYNVTVLDRSGSVLFKISNVSGRPAVDENGYIYDVPGVILDPQPASLTDYYKDYGYRVPSNAVDAYGPDGTLYWHRDIDAQVVRQGDRSLPLYQNGTLWAPVANGVWALNMDGSVRWKKQYDGYTVLYRALPLDSHDNVYIDQFAKMSGHNNWEQYHIISRDGTETLRVGSPDSAIYAGSAVSADANTGALYAIQLYSDGTYPVPDFISSDQYFVPTVNMTVYSLVDDKVLWSHTFLPNLTETVITSDNVDKFLSPNVQYIGYAGNIITDRSIDYGCCNPIAILPGNGVVYVTYHAAYYEWPIVSGQSKCAYESEIYAFEKNNGTLLWKKPLGSMVSSVAVNNSTLYYGTSDGKVFVQQLWSVAGGLAAVAASYLFIKFFLMGAVTRARNRLNMNENRNIILAYILDNPGSTLREISRGLEMNMGTLRYHMFILGMNHRVISYMADDKHVRYFKNSNAFSKEEQLVISLMKREGVRRVLNMLHEKPGLSNSELSTSLSMQDSATSRYMKELLNRGIISKGFTREGKTVFSIKDEYRERIDFAIEHINSKI